MGFAFWCPKCRRKFYKPNTLGKHIIDEHPDEARELMEEALKEYDEKSGTNLLWTWKTAETVHRREIRPCYTTYKCWNNIKRTCPWADDCKEYKEGGIEKCQL